MTTKSNDNSCTTGGSVSQKNGFNLVDGLNTKREFENTRMGMSTITPSQITCSLSGPNTSDLCKLKTPGHALLLDATWDRALQSSSSCKTNVNEK